MTNQTKTNNLNYLINLKFNKVNRFPPNIHLDEDVLKTS